MMLEVDKQEFHQQLEWLVDLLANESAPYLEERPRYAHGILVLADHSEPGELIKASLIKSLDDVSNSSGHSYSQKSQVFERAFDSGVHEQVSSPDLDTSTEGVGRVDVLPKAADLIYLPLHKSVQKNTLPPPPSPSSLRNLQEHEHSSSFTAVRMHENPAPILLEQSRANTENIIASQVGGQFHIRSPSSYDYNDNYTMVIPQIQGTQYEHPEIVHRCYRSQVDEQTFPSIDRFRTVRQETVRMTSQPRRPSAMSPLSNCSSSTPTFNSLSSYAPSQGVREDAIEKAVRILQDSCEMLDETAERIASRCREQTAATSLNRPSYSSAFQFPSQLRSTNY